jgi:hypothetical protein
VINAYTRWMNVAGVDVRPQFWGYTLNTAAGAGELLIQMDPSFGGGRISRLASAFSSFNKSTIIFHRRNAVDGTPWNFVPYSPGAGEFDMQAILMHEIGHSLGLDHSASANDVMFPSYIWTQRFGPFEGDVAVLKSLYPDFNQNRLRQVRSTDAGGSWSPVPNELTAYNHVHARTTQSAGATGISRTGLYLLNWSHANRIPTTLRTDGEKFLLRLWYYYGGERSVHGHACASDADGHLLWAWVHNDDSGSLRIMSSANRGLHWAMVGVPANATSHGTPGLAWTQVGGQSTWILVWAHFDRNDQANSGKILASLSTDNGNTWSPPVTLNNFSKALSGVAVAASMNNEIVVAFAFASPQVAGMNSIHTLRCQINAGQLQVISYIGTIERTRIQPALAYDVNHANFVMAWREQNFNTTLATTNAVWGTLAWSSRVDLLGTASHVAPTLASVPEYGEIVLWYAFEGP